MIKEMSELKGIDYTISPEKIERDERYKTVLTPLASRLEAMAVNTLADQITPGANAYYPNDCVTSDGMLALPKIRTMRDDDTATTDVELGFHKANPRIVSKAAVWIRDLAIDELPQLQLIPRLSMVGPRAINEGFMDFLVDIGEKRDKGVTKDWVELRQYPLVRDGLSGVAQLRWQWTDERNPDLMYRCMQAELKYYLEQASARRDGFIIAGTPLVLATSSLWKRLRH